MCYHYIETRSSRFIDGWGKSCHRKHELQYCCDQGDRSLSHKEYRKSLALLSSCIMSTMMSCAIGELHHPFAVQSASYIQGVPVKAFNL